MPRSKNKLQVEQTICEQATLTLDAAVAKMLSSVAPLNQCETVAIGSVLGRILAASITAPIATPPFDNSAMDGYARRAADPSEAFVCRGTSFAGKPYDGSVSTGECVRIMTGAMMPAALDCVIPQEYAHTIQEGDVLRVSFDLMAKPGLNVRYQGEDIAAGAEILRQGRKLKSVDIALLASLGVTQVEVFKRPSVAVISSGDELVSPGKTLAAGQIYDSNRSMLSALLQGLPVDYHIYAVVKDDPAAIDQLLAEADRDHDIIISTGGVSVGEADYMRAAFEKLGTIEFWKIKMKPGKPLAFGSLSRSVFLGLPGNPVSAVICFEKFALPLIYRLSGGEYPAPLKVNAITEEVIRKKPGREEFLRGVLTQKDGENRISVRSAQGSAMLHSLSEANALVHLPADCAGVKAGETVSCEWQPYILR